MPKYRECSVDEYLAKRKPVTRDGIVYRAAGAPKTFNAEERSQVFVMTDESVDSYGDVVKAGGADLYRFEKNPIALLNHKSDMILGTWSEVQKKPQRIEGKVTLAKEGTAPHIDMAYNLMGQGILRGASIGFMPTKLEMRLDDDGDPMWCYLIHEWELYECSVVSIPANPSALARSIGDHDDLIIARDYVEQVLDGWARSPEGILMPRAEFEKAYTVLVEKIADDAIEPAAVSEERAVDDGDIDPVDDAEIVAFKGFLDKSLNDGDEVHVYFKLEGAGVIEKGVTISHQGTDKIDKFEFASEMTAEHKAAITERLTEIAAAKATTQPENKQGTGPVVVTLDLDDSEAKKKIEGIGGMLAKLAEKFPIFFGKGTEPDRIEPVIVEPAQVKAPDPEAARKALEHATLLRARLATNGRLAA